VNTFEYTDGREVPIVAEYHGHDFGAWVLHDVEGFYPWPVTWTDGINFWLEGYDDVVVALARFTALLRACESNTFLVHHIDLGHRVDVGQRDAFEAEVERFVSRVVHASSCQPGCDGTDPANHQV
jgi:hypothetical protein